VTAEDIQAVYWQALSEAGDWHVTSGQAAVQSVMQLKAWDAVIAAVRKDSEMELERLRAEVRTLTECIVKTIEGDA
jgi:hypothetical protein